MKRQAMTIRVSEEVHRLLLVAAASNGQSVNEWAAHHLEQIAREEVALYVKTWESTR